MGIANRRRGKIIEAGWAVWYLFGSDEKSEYLDYYAAHRMTNDRHVRIYENGEECYLPAIQESWISSGSAEEKKKQQEEYYAKNRAVARMVEEKGFGIEGNEPGGVQMNRMLHLEKMK